MADPRLKIDVDPVMAQRQDFLNSLDTFIATAKTFADGVEGTGAFWQGDARMAAYSTGLDLHTRLNQVHQWGLTLVDNVGTNVNVMHQNEADAAQLLYGAGGDGAGQSV